MQHLLGKPYAINLTAESENLELSMLPAFDTEEFPGSSAVWKAEVNIDIDMPTVIKAVVSSNPEANSQWEVVRQVVNRHRSYMRLLVH